jgi:hypothetical protein
MKETEPLTETEIRLMVFLLRTRLRYESQRRRNVVRDGVDIQYQKVRQLNDLMEKLEAMQLAK